MFAALSSRESQRRVALCNSVQICLAKRQHQNKKSVNSVAHPKKRSLLMFGPFMVMFSSFSRNNSK